MEGQATTQITTGRLSSSTQITVAAQFTLRTLDSLTQDEQQVR